MAITTYAQLLTAVSDYIGKRADLGTVDDDFVVLAEARMNYGNYDPQFPTPPLRVRQMETRSTLSPTAEYVALSSDFLEIIALKCTSTTPERGLVSMPSAMFDRKLSNDNAGDPVYYDIVGDNLRINPPMTSGSLEILYYAAIPPLVTTDPNWLLTANPAVYLYGALLEAAIYVDEDNDIIKYGRMFSGLAQAMQFSGKDSGLGQPMQMQNPIIVKSGFVRG